MLLLATAFAQDAHVLRAPAATASSFLRSNWNKYEENYHPSYALDGNPATAWVEGVEGDGAGQSITWSTSALASARSVTLRIRNGYQKSEALFAANGAPKDVLIQLHGGAEKAVTLTRTMGWQEVTIDNGGKPMRGVTLTLVSTYPGTKYRDTCLSDVEVRVDSDVAYNAAVEEAKKAELDAWVKGRVAEAKYYASLPADYPFASTRFTRKEEPLTGPEWAAAVRELRQNTGWFDEEKVWYRLQVARPIVLPDGLDNWDILAEGAHGSPVSAGNLLRTSDFSLFEATAEQAFHRGNPEDMPGELWLTNARVVKREGQVWEMTWKARQVVEERSLYTAERQYVVLYEAGRVSRLWVGDPTLPAAGRLFRYHWNDAGKIDQVEELRAIQDSDGDLEFETDAVMFYSYVRTVYRAE